MLRCSPKKYLDKQGKLCCRLSTRIDEKKNHFNNMSSDTKFPRDKEWVYHTSSRKKIEDMVTGTISQELKRTGSKVLSENYTSLS